MKKYAKDFKGKEENFQYVGKRYLMEAGEEELKKRGTCSAVLLAVSTLMLFLALTRNNVGNRGTLMVLFSVALCFPIVYGWMGVWNLFSYIKKEEKQTPGSLTKRREGGGFWMRRMDYDRCVRRPWRCSLMAALFGGATLAGGSDPSFWAESLLEFGGDPERGDSVSDGFGGDHPGRDMGDGSKSGSAQKSSGRAR